MRITRRQLNRIIRETMDDQRDNIPAEMARIPLKVGFDRFLKQFIDRREEMGAGSDAAFKKLLRKIVDEFLEKEVRPRGNR
jgi:hypothetical protein